MSTTLPPSDRVLAGADRVADLPWRDVSPHQGVRERLLWSGDGQVAGVMAFEPGAVMARHVHEDRSHHIWVTEGTVRIDDEELSAGSYVHVPAGVPHEVRGGPEGCAFFYVFIG